MNTESLPSTKETSVWVVEDNGVFQESLVDLLNDTSYLTCTGAFNDFEAVEHLLAGPSDITFPDVILMDIQLGEGKKDGIEATRLLICAYPELKIIMLTMMDDASRVKTALEAGAVGYLLKESMDQNLAAIHEAAQGKVSFSKPIGQKVLSFFYRSPSVNPYKLTARQKEVLRLMTDAYTQIQIGEKLFISPDTVGNHVRGIYEKLGVNSRSGAVAKALREGLV